METVARLRAREVSATEVAEAHLARIDAINPALNAVVDAVPDALEQARAIDAGTRPPGLLHGAPVTTKINTDQAGLRNTNGLPGLAKNIAPGDAPVVANLKAAGGVIVGRTNTPEFSVRWCTSNPLHGVSLNPWDAGATPGGSSGAAAAAVATGMGVIAHGNDLGGSVRYPAYCCGVAGLRPSMGRIPAFNPTAAAGRPPVTASMSVQGPLGRSVADVQLGLDAMRAWSVEDPTWTAAPGHGRTRQGTPITLGFAEDAFDTAPHPQIRAAMAKARAAAKAAGMAVRDVTLPEAERCAALWGALLFTETKVTAMEQIKQFGSEDLRDWIDTFIAHFEQLDLAGYIAGMTERSVLQRKWNHLFDDVDFVVMPTSLIPPFENDLDFLKPEEGPRIIDAQKPLYVVNLIGLPSLALPTHVAEGLPLGVQVIGPMHDDDAVLAAGATLEAALGPVLGQMPAPYRL